MEINFKEGRSFMCKFYIVLMVRGVSYSHCIRVLTLKGVGDILEPSPNIHALQSLETLV